jgi:hypothetical protein
MKSNPRQMVKSLEARWSAIVLTLFISTGCSDMGFPEYIKLDNLRIVALILDSPEVAAGGTVNVTPVVSDYNATRTLTFVAEACPDPGLVLGRDPTCDGHPLKVSVGSGNVVFPVAQQATNRTGLTTALAAITVPATLTTGLSADSQFNGVFYLVTYTVTASDGTRVKSFARIRVSNKTTKNTNPTITDVLANGSSLTTMPTSDAYVAISYSGTSKESFVYQRSDGTQTTQTETLSTTWFYTAGAMKFYRTVDAENNTFTPTSSSAPTGLNHVILVITRDGREGTAAAVRFL